MDDLHEQSVALRSLGNKTPTDDLRAQVVSALRSKHEGIQSVALDVLGRWGEQSSVTVLREFLREALTREAGWGIRTVVIRNLRTLVTAADAVWALEMYFSVADHLVQHELLDLITALPPESARSRLVAGLRDNNPNNRLAAVKAISRMAFPDRRSLITPLRDDPNKTVSKSARFLAAEA